jgi:hypothetical protein
MKWQHISPNIVIGGEARHKEALLTPLLIIFVGNQGMFPLIASGRRRSNKR